MEQAQQHRKWKKGVLKRPSAGIIKRPAADRPRICTGCCKFIKPEEYDVPGLIVKVPGRSGFLFHYNCRWTDLGQEQYQALVSDSESGDTD